MAQVEGDIRERVRQLPRLRDQVPSQQPILRQSGPRWLRKLQTRVPQVALQTSQGHDSVLRVQRLRANKECANYTDQNHSILPRSVQVDLDYREENREAKGGREEQAAGLVHARHKLPWIVKTTL